MPRLLWIIGFCICIVGCPQPKSDEPASTAGRSEAERPPLRILVMGESRWMDVVTRRWQSISEQRLDIKAMTADEMISLASIKADVLILESRWLPTIVERSWISPLPKQLTESPLNSTAIGLRHDEWPLVWRQSATYGQRLWGIPLGVPMMAIVDQTSSQSTEIPSWRERVTARELQIRETKTAVEAPNAAADNFLLDRFLIMAASMNPSSDDSGFFFNINSAQARLNETWLIKAATLFGQLHLDRSEMASMPPDSAWQDVANKKSGWALAWPSLQGESSLTVRALSPWVDTGRGLVASSTSKNRQSAATNRFLVWLNEDDQRQELATVSSTVQPIPERWSSTSERIDVNRYRDQMKQAFDDRFVVHELRFAESLPYRQRLVEAVLAILKNPSDAEAELKRCAADWDRLTARIGRDIQKQRLARAFELEAYRE